MSTDVLKAAAPWMQVCGPHDFGVDTAPCGCPPDGDPRVIVSKLATEVQRLREELDAARELVGVDLPPEQWEAHAYKLGAAYEAAAPRVGTFLGWLAYRHENERQNNKILRTTIEHHAAQAGGES